MIARLIKADTGEVVQQFNITWFEVEERLDGKFFSFNDTGSYHEDWITEQELRELQYVISVSDDSGEFFKFEVSGD